MKRLFKLFRTFLLKHPVPFLVIGLSFLFIDNADCQDTKLQLNDLDYFETQGLNVFVFSNQYNGFFYDEKTRRIYMIDGSVYAPKYYKRNLIQQMDVTLQSFRTKAELSKERIDDLLDAVKN